MKIDEWRLVHGLARMRFPNLAFLRTFTIFRELFQTWPWEETHVVDVGACVGSFCLAVAEAQPKVKLSVFEPWPDSLRWLEDNLNTQNRMRCTLYRMAASTTKGKRLMVEGPRWGMSHLSDVGGGVMVETDRLDDVLDKPVSLIKIDVEGHELDVLNGARGILERDHPRLILEMLPNMQAQGGHELDELPALLAEFGYQYKLPISKTDVLYSTQKVVGE